MVPVKNVEAEDLIGQGKNHKWFNFMDCVRFAQFGNNFNHYSNTTLG